MKKSLLFAGIALLAFAVSCDLVKDSLDGQEIKVESHSDVTTSDFIGLESNDVTTSYSGESIYQLDCKQPLEASLTLSDQKTAIPGSVKIDGTALPEPLKPQKGTADNFGIFVDIDNSAQVPAVVFEAQAKVDNKVITLPGVTIEGGKKARIFYGDEQYVPATEKPDYIVPVVNKDYKESIGHGFSEIVLENMTVTPVASKGIVPAATPADFKILAKFCSLFSFSKGTEITVNRSFNDLKLSLDRLNEYIFDKYDVYLTITNPVPFKILASATSESGITAAALDAVEAGTPENPKTSTVVIRVVDNSGRKVSEIESADLTLQLTAAQDRARLVDLGQFKIDVDKIVVVNK